MKINFHCLCCWYLIAKQCHNMIMMNMEILLNHLRVHQLALVVCLLTWEAQVSNTVEINPIVTKWTLHTPNLKIGRQVLWSLKIERNKLQIRTNCQIGTGTKMAEKLNKFKKFEKKKISAMFLTQTPLVNIFAWSSTSSESTNCELRISTLCLQNRWRNNSII